MMKKKDAPPLIFGSIMSSAFFSFSVYSSSGIWLTLTPFYLLHRWAIFINSTIKWKYKDTDKGAFAMI
jgi:hypothetical protein